MEKTIRDLCKRVAATRGLDTDMDSVTQYQDLIGHATIEENAELANTPELMETFYRIYGVAYGTVEAIKFYMTNSNKVIDMKYQLDEYKAIYENQKNAEQVQKERAEELRGKLGKAEQDIKTLEGEVEYQKKINKTYDDEVVRLKAKLYDLQEENEVLRKAVM